MCLHPVALTHHMTASAKEAEKWREAHEYWVRANSSHTVCPLLTASQHRLMQLTNPEERSTQSLIQSLHQIKCPGSLDGKWSSLSGKDMDLLCPETCELKKPVICPLRNISSQKRTDTCNQPSHSWKGRWWHQWLALGRDSEILQADGVKVPHPWLVLILQSGERLLSFWSWLLIAFVKSLLHYSSASSEVDIQEAWSSRGFYSLCRWLAAG